MLRSFSFGSAGDIFWIFSYFDVVEVLQNGVPPCLRSNSGKYYFSPYYTKKRYTKLLLWTWRATHGFPPPTHPRVRRDAGLHLFGYPRRPETASQKFINRQGSEHYDHGAQLARDQTWCTPARTPLSVPLKVFSRWRESTVCA